MKKVLSTILALMMVFSAVSVFAGDFDDISASETAEAVADLNALSVMVGDTNGDFRGEATITRAEFSVILCRIAGFEDAAKSYPGHSSFEDVEGHWAKGYIELAKQAGYINGYSATSFGPQDNVTVGQAVKMLVCLLGYEDRYVREEGFPYGFTKKGESLGLAGESRMASHYLSNLANVPATRNFVAFIVSNALDIPLRDWISSNGMTGDNEVAEYIIYDGLGGRELRTLRTENFNK